MPWASNSRILIALVATKLAAGGRNSAAPTPAHRMVKMANHEEKRKGWQAMTQALTLHFRATRRHNDRGYPNNHKLAKKPEYEKLKVTEEEEKLSITQANFDQMLHVKHYAHMAKLHTQRRLSVGKTV